MGSQSRDTLPKTDFLAFKERLNSQAHLSAHPDSIAHIVKEHAAPEYQRSIVPSQASQILTEEQSDFLWYSNHNLGSASLRQTHTRFKQLFPKTSLSDEIIHRMRIDGGTRLNRRRIACEMKSRLVDIAPHCASKYPWVENYHKQEISEANLGQAMLPSVELEYLRPFSAEALDFLWFLHFDLGLSACILLDIFRP